MCREGKENEKRMLDVKKIRLYLFDMDGTIYLGDNLFPFTKELLKTIREKGNHYLFMTNNSSKSVSDYVKKLARLGIEATEDDFITSSQATADYLKKNLAGKKLFVSGTRSFLSELAENGVKNIHDSYSEDIEAVVTGFDTELTFAKLEAMSKLLTRDIPFIAANPDLVCPTEYGYVPDCGSVCAMITNATGKKPYYIGKPRPEMPLFAIERINRLDSRVCAENTLVVGDRIYTDIASGVNAGTKTLLVLSGETTLGQAKAHEIKSDAIFDDCGVILDILKGGEAK